MATHRSMKAWDTRVREANRDPVVIDLPDPDSDDGGTFQVIVYPFTGKSVRELMDAQRDGDDYAQLELLFGDQADKVQRVFDDAPFGASQSLMESILKELGVISGNR